MTARSYVVGLPVVVTVHDDGTVEYDVDTSEAGCAIRDDEDGNFEHHGWDTVKADSDLVDADHERRQRLLDTLRGIADRD